DIAHADGEVKLSSVSMSWVSVSLAGFQVTISGRFWVTPEGRIGEEHRFRQAASELRPVNWT
ncbi:MAG: hypothetical protein ABSH05_19545, partial [Bryobacteraceae bacterium]